MEIGMSLLSLLLLDALLASDGGGARLCLVNLLAGLGGLEEALEEGVEDSEGEHGGKEEGAGAVGRAEDVSGVKVQPGRSRTAHILASWGWRRGV